MGGMTLLSGRERSFGDRLPAFALPLCAFVLLLFQAASYLLALPLSLGPRVILQPWLLASGYVPYEQIVDLHPPLMPMLLAAMRVGVPDGLLLAKLVLVFLLSLSTVLVYFAARRSAGPLAGLFAVLFLVLWSPSVEGGKLWYESFLAPLYVMSLFFFDAPRRPFRSWLLAGLLCGVAVLVKQHAALGVAAFGLWNLALGRRQGRSWQCLRRECVALVIGFLLPLAALLGWQALRAGNLSGLFHWTVEYVLFGDYRQMARHGFSLAQLGRVLPAFLLLPLALFVLPQRWKKGDPDGAKIGWGVVLLLVGSFTLYPRYAPFHLQAVLPVLAWLSAVGLVLLWRSLGRTGRRVLAGAVSLLVLCWIFTAGSVYRSLFASGPGRRIWEYSDLATLETQLEAQIGPAGSIYLLPDDEATANLYYRLGRLPPRYWVFGYPWYLTGAVERQMLSALREASPQWIVYFPGRWAIEQTAPGILAYVRWHYRLAGPLSWPAGEARLLRRQGRPSKIGK